MEEEEAGAHKRVRKNLKPLITLSSSPPLNTWAFSLLDTHTWERDSEIECCMFDSGSQGCCYHYYEYLDYRVLGKN